MIKVVIKKIKRLVSRTRTRNLLFLTVAYLLGIFTIISGDFSILFYFSVGILASRVAIRYRSKIVNSVHRILRRFMKDSNLAFKIACLIYFDGFIFLAVILSVLLNLMLKFI